MLDKTSRTVYPIKYHSGRDDTMEWILLGLLFCILILQIVLLLRRRTGDAQELRLALAKDASEQQLRMAQQVDQSIQNLRVENEKRMDDLQTHLEQAVAAGAADNRERILQGAGEQSRMLQEMEKAILKQNHEAQEKIMEKLVASVETMNRVNGEKLSEIHRNINERLDKALNERLDSSFEKIGQQLGSLYKAVGELQSLTNGVENLNRTLSNVKTRGTWGEMQLEQILANIFPDSLYDKNVQIKKNSQERVEFALKIPDKTDGGRSIYLPIDSKFPADLYAKIQEAAAGADRKGVETAVRELEGRIKSEARDISTKYINAPDTTDFAIMFLPSEGLYSEVLRIPGLAEYCQRELKVVISGPTTLSALLNSLAVGFKFLTVSRNTQEVLRVLQNVRGQYEKFGDLIDKTQRNLDLAVRSTDEMKKRTDLIQKRLDKVSALEGPEMMEFLPESTEGDRV